MHTLALSLKHARACALSRSPALSRTQVQSFAMDTKEEVVKALSQLTALAPQQRLTSVVLDLRGNPGGLLSSAVGVAEVCAATAPLILQ